MPPPPHHTLALITIGQSPRHDYTPDLPFLLPARTTLAQHGALDALSLAVVRATLAPRPGDPVLVSRMRDGTQVTLSAPLLAPLLGACVRRVARSGAADAIVLLCTGEDAVPEGVGVPVVMPQEAVRRWLEESGRGRGVVVVSPEERQVGPARGRWKGVGGCRVVAGRAATPYGEGSAEEVRQCAEWIRGVVEAEGMEVLVYLDCMGYTLEHKRMVEEVVGGKVEVVVPREVVFKAAGKVLGEE
ncbi:hypothetical protein GTA08_BOTSDO06205 [Botryosphaeria dothidea]|uniref:AroM family protein n=1 Tax=Botryosphaeria dothidea TaxID=55169 RepID=A0A8H4N1C7_9PEZI|nr:hypothetical protein GTA08_BOTSDO10294 [Botryosphaeria dothidea]KAF4305703.1 hypothetical protein GTA08_BOTSDO06205 [Botryosphaeria dothidea]